MPADYNLKRSHVLLYTYYQTQNVNNTYVHLYPNLMSHYTNNQNQLQYH